MKKRVRCLDSAGVFHDRRFPLRVILNPAHGPTGMHRHEFEELVIILAGRGRHVTNRDACVFEAGEVFMIRRDMSHAYADTHDMSLVNILFDPGRLRLPLADLGDVPGYHALFRIEPRLLPRERTGGRLKLTTDQLTEAARLVADLNAELAQREPGYRFMAMARLMRLIGFLSRCYTRVHSPASRSIMGIGDVLSHIERHYGQPLSVSGLARMAHMSESSLTRAFRKVMGRPPMDHVIRVRLAKAAEMLRLDDARVTEIALLCGFNDSNYFARQFRRNTGRTPREFRQTERRNAP